MQQVRIKDKLFEILIPYEEIQKAVAQIAIQINKDFKNQKLLFLPILNGSFLFAADLFKKLTIECEVSFVKIATYNGMSGGAIKNLIGINENLKNKSVIIIEDIVDKGNTIESITNSLIKYEPKEIKTAALLFKPESYTKNIRIDYVGIKVPNAFLLGYGLDYDGLGRNLNNIYKLIT